MINTVRFITLLISMAYMSHDSNHLRMNLIDKTFIRHVHKLILVGKVRDENKEFPAVLFKKNSIQQNDCHVHTKPSCPSPSVANQVGKCASVTA